MNNQQTNDIAPLDPPQREESTGSIAGSVSPGIGNLHPNTPVIRPAAAKAERSSATLSGREMAGIQTPAAGPDTPNRPYSCAKIIPLPRNFLSVVESPTCLKQGTRCEMKAHSDRLLHASYQLRVESVQLIFHIPESIVKDFKDYVNRLEDDGTPWKKMWLAEPFHVSLNVGIPGKGEYGWNWPINRRHNGLSLKGRIKRIRQLSKRERSVTVTQEVHPSLWERINERATFYGITEGELCQSCIFYHADFERQRREKARPKSSFESFERGLAKEARKARSTTSSAAAGKTVSLAKRG